MNSFIIVVNNCLCQKGLKINASYKKSINQSSKLYLNSPFKFGWTEFTRLSNQNALVLSFGHQTTHIIPLVQPNWCFVVSFTHAIQYPFKGGVKKNEDLKKVFTILLFCKAMDFRLYLIKQPQHAQRINLGGFHTIRYTQNRLMLTYPWHKMRFSYKFTEVLWIFLLFMTLSLLTFIFRFILFIYIKDLH